LSFDSRYLRNLQTRHFERGFNCYISVAIAYSLPGIFPQNFSRGLKRSSTSSFASKFTSHDGGGRHFEIYFNGHNSVITAHVFTKFGTETNKKASPAHADKPARRGSMQKLLQFDVFRLISPNSISPNFKLPMHSVTMMILVLRRCVISQMISDRSYHYCPSFCATKLYSYIQRFSV